MNLTKYREIDFAIAVDVVSLETLLTLGAFGTCHDIGNRKIEHDCKLRITMRDKNGNLVFRLNQNTLILLDSDSSLGVDVLQIVDFLVGVTAAGCADNQYAGCQKTVNDRFASHIDFNFYFQSHP